ncbi:substrate-binding domain-containing protein [Streptococcus mitis]|uniref:Periplasmic binding s and sugar binding domain of LacI family protein n=1 Tax=Streptococcus mitis TaxID=28037 RepID=A0A081R087_STRMT|nr:substrate-binding domain-containing protein [Streptococcus mitis]KEQ48610.1 periplasmic binding s and sugar binding domain of LacI family protein [Streptococcus mitis]
MSREYTRTIVKIIFCTVVVFVFAIYTHVSQTDPIPGQIKVGATYMTMNSEFYRHLHNEIQRYSDSEGQILYTRDAEMSEEKQSKQIDEFIEKRVNVIVINPVKSDSEQIVEALSRAKNFGIRVIAVDSQLNNIKVDTSIVSDNYHAGILIAKDLMKRTSNAHILLLTHKDALSANQRITGFLDTIKSEEHYQIISERETVGQTEYAMTTVGDALSEGLQFDAIVALNDRAAIGALAAIKELKVTSKKLIYGIDGSPDMKHLLATTDEVTGTVAQFPSHMGRKVSEIIDLLVKKEEVEELYTIPVQFVDKNNIIQFDINGWQ